MLFVTGPEGLTASAQALSVLVRSGQLNRLCMRREVRDDYIYKTGFGNDLASLKSPFNVFSIFQVTSCQLRSAIASTTISHMAAATDHDRTDPVTHTNPPIEPRNPRLPKKPSSTTPTGSKKPRR